MKRVHRNSILVSIFGAVFIMLFQNCSSNKSSSAPSASAVTLLGSQNSHFILSTQMLVLTEGEAGNLKVSVNPQYPLTSNVKINWKVIQDNLGANPDPRVGTASGSFTFTQFMQEYPIFFFTIDDSIVNGAVNPVSIEMSSPDNPNLYWKVPVVMKDND